MVVAIASVLEVNADPPGRYRVRPVQAGPIHREGDFRRLAWVGRQRLVGALYPPSGLPTLRGSFYRRAARLLCSASTGDSSDKDETPKDCP